MARARAAAFFLPLIRSDFDNALEEGGGVTGAHAPWIMALAGSGRWRGRGQIGLGTGCAEGAARKPSPSALGYNWKNPFS
jgi:hypothetical protein